MIPNKSSITSSRGLYHQSSLYAIPQVVGSIVPYAQYQEPEVYNPVLKDTQVLFSGRALGPQWHLNTDSFLQLLEKLTFVGDLFLMHSLILFPPNVPHYNIGH